jgi:hypothetical protein
MSVENAIVLNGIRMTLSSDTFPAWAVDMPDNKALRPLREQIGDEWFLHWRDGKAFGIPKVRKPAKKFGTGPHALACTDHLSLLSSRIDNILPLKFPKYKALRARPFTFLGQRKEIVAASRKNCGAGRMTSGDSRFGRLFSLRPRSSRRSPPKSRLACFWISERVGKFTAPWRISGVRALT